MNAPTLRTAAATRGLLRLTTAGSVDDGKSTLIGRLLHDTRSLFEDQLDQIAGAGRRGEGGALDLALVTDGLRAEREQGITIDVAYRYFSTPVRSFVIADTPGHLEYTRNMVTGASTADLALILVDAEKGIVTQSRRHAFLSALLGISHLVVVVNKMDLVGFDEGAFRRVEEDFLRFARGLEGVEQVEFVPASALHGDNVVEPSGRTPWYGGGPLLSVLEAADPRTREAPLGLRFPVQHVVRAPGGFRGYAGTPVAGALAPGDRVRILPGGGEAVVDQVLRFEGPVERARAGTPVVVRTVEEVDVARGSLLVHPDDPPVVSDRIEAELCWMGDRPLELHRPYLVVHGTRRLRARVSRLLHRVDVDTLRALPASTLTANDIGRVHLVAAEPMAFDRYTENRTTGSFLLVDPDGKDTVAAGLIRGAAAHRPVSPHVTPERPAISRRRREERSGHRAGVVWFTGISGAGKSTLARRVEEILFDRGVRTALLDGDTLRAGLSGDLGFSDGDRSENLRRAGEVARILFDLGHLVLCAFVSPHLPDRERARGRFPRGRFLEIHVDAPLEEVRRRDPKGLYRGEAEGRVAPLPGSRAPFEAPSRPELRIDTTRLTPGEGAEAVVRLLEEAGLVPPRELPGAFPAVRPGVPPTDPPEAESEP